MRSNPTSSVRLPPHLTAVFTLARLLQRMELGHTVDAGQYRSVAERLAQELEAVSADEALSAVLQAHPAAAELYENLHYRHAGLCRSPLELAVEAENRTRALLARLGRHDEAGRPV